MKERPIERIWQNNRDPNDKLREVAKAFTNKDYLTQQDIEQISENIASAIKEKIHLLNNSGEIKNEDNQIEFIIDTLNPTEMLHYCTKKNGGFFNEAFQLTPNKYRLVWDDANGKEQEDTITKEELNPHLKTIQIAVLNKLSGILPSNITTRITQEMRGRVSELSDGRFYKDEGTRFHSEGQRAEVEALKQLYSLPERSPFIYYGIEILDKRRAGTISKPLNLTDIHAELQKPFKPPLDKILNYLKDIIEGHLFLLKNNLILLDSSIRNLGINQDTNTGILFDMDGIRKLRAPLNFYSAPPEYISPEYVEGTPPTESNIVWELGIGMQKIWTYYPWNKDNYRKNSKTPAQLVALVQLSSEMVNKNPEKRPTLDQVKERLGEILNIN